MRTPSLLAFLAAGSAASAQSCILTYHAPPPIIFNGAGGIVYHAGLHQVLLVDTYGDATTRIWAWDGSTWSIIATGGPGQREYASVAYDVTRDRLVLFGGDTNQSNFLSDTWEWDRTAWSQRATNGPSPRSQQAMTYDESRQRTVLFGGYHQPPVNLYHDTWEWDGQSWTRVATAGPAAAYYPRLTYDPLHARTLYCTNSDSGSTTQLWEWDGVQWSQYAGGIAGVDLNPWFVFDRSRSRLVLGSSGIVDFDLATGASVLRQPVTNVAGLAAYDASRAVTVIANSYNTLEYNGAASETSAYTAPSGPQGGNYHVGDTITVSVDAGGSAPLTFQWSRDGQPLSDGGRISGATTPTLTITGATVGDNGNYNVQVSNPCSTVSPYYAAIVVVSPDCYPNCDGSTTPPILNVNDFVCFQSQFAAGHEYADCDHSSSPPALNVNDFICFLARFAAGCSAP